ncbi:MAG: carbohydrate binding family 9 domain-containing protein, partial [Gemmatimonadaceae bacterium]
MDARILTAATIVLAAALQLRPLAAQTAAVPSLPTMARPSIDAVRRASAVVIDGRLDDGAWQGAAVARGFVQKTPVEGTPAEYATEVRLLYDDDAIYVGARMFDTEPQSIARQVVRRDEEGNADWFAVAFDPRLDRRTGYVFFVSAAN